MPEITLSDDITINETLVFEPKTRAAVTEALAEGKSVVLSQDVEATATIKL